MRTGVTTRVLFVDDEPLVLQGLQRILRPLSNNWEMVFVTSGHEALQAMRSDPFSVIISDMQMPGMNGAQLLTEIAETYPKTVRLILSGHADKNAIIQCVGVAHQFLAKPCEPEELKAAIAHALHFENSVKSDAVKGLIAQMTTLPSVPSLFYEINKKLRDENSSLEDVAEVVARDIGMTAKLLKLVNSAFFGLKRQISSPVEAVTFLGLDTIKALVLAVNAFSCFDGKANGPISMETIWAHSLHVAKWSRKIACFENASQKEIDECFTAGMLHDVGKLALCNNLPAGYREALEVVDRDGLTMPAAEEKIFGANHAEIGGYLLRLWGLPARVVDTISFHHNPCTSAAETFLPLAAVHAADVFSNQSNGLGGLADNTFVTQHNLNSKLASWQTLQP
jgi:HD-like signal output (HDOD) protein/CheY-like chemotaxis protein